MTGTTTLTGVYFLAFGLVIFFPLFLANNLATCVSSIPSANMPLFCPHVSQETLNTEYVGLISSTAGLGLVFSGFRRTKRMPEAEA
jgi:hypothetical protein